MTKLLIALAGLGGYALWRWNARRVRHGDHVDAAGPQASAAPNRGPLNVWENEGGALPVKPHLGPEPSVLGEAPKEERSPA